MHSVKLDVWQDIDSENDSDRQHYIEGDAAGLEALREAISTVLEKKGAITVGVKTKGGGTVIVELKEDSAP